MESSDFDRPISNEPNFPEISDSSYGFLSCTDDYSFELVGRVEEKIQMPSDFESWCANRSRLFTLSGNKVYEGVVHHRPWHLKRFNVLKLEETFSRK